MDREEGLGLLGGARRLREAGGGVGWVRPWAARWPAEGDVAGVDQVASYPGRGLKFEPQRGSSSRAVLSKGNLVICALGPSASRPFGFSLDLCNWTTAEVLALEDVAETQEATTFYSGPTTCMPPAKCSHKRYL